jgi:lipoic acid synthetase
MEETKSAIRKHPSWLKVRFPGGENYHELKKLVRGHQLHTVCESANCPNIGECWEKSTATFMILGNICTRRCAFCAVKTGRPQSYDRQEPQRVAEAVWTLKLRHAVITSVDRDDLPDEGSRVFAETIRLIRQRNPNTSVEVLIPDFKGSRANLDAVIEAYPDILAHNLDTIPRLYPKIKPKSSYPRSLELLAYVKQKDPAIKTKTGFMLGLGEELDEITQGMENVKGAQVDILTLGQYLRPSIKHAPLVRHYSPEEYAEFKQIGEARGIPHVESGPLVRSSYHAAEQLEILSNHREGHPFPMA